MAERRGRGRRAPGGDTGEEEKVERRQIKGKCDTRKIPVARTNGEPHTLYWPKNVGACPLHLVTLDNDGNEVAGSALNFSTGQEFESYTSPRGGVMIAFYCEGGADEDCTLEIDRR